MNLLRAIRSAVKYLASGKERKLYRQWVEMAELPPENIAHEEVREHLVQERVRAEIQTELKPPSGLRTLYILQVLGLVMMGAILIILIVQSC